MIQVGILVRIVFLPYLKTTRFVLIVKGNFDQISINCELTRTGLETYYQNAESLYFKGFQRILPHRCPKFFYTNFINLDRGGFEAKLSSTSPYK